MCNCSKQISQTDCQKLLDCLLDTQKRFFIYHIFTESNGKNRLEIACVGDKNPNDVAIERGFIGEDGNPEWYNINEHPCIYKNGKN